MTTDTQPRWRMSLQELCARLRIRPTELDHWAEIGAFGPRLQEPRDRGWHRHITREIAQRATIMKHLTDVGISEGLAVNTVLKHRVRSSGELVVTAGRETLLIIDRDALDLP